MTVVRLFYKGCDVRLVRELERGQVRVQYLSKGQPLDLYATVWPHELAAQRGGLEAVKRAIADLRTATQQPETSPRAFLHAHHVAAAEDREDQDE